MSNIISFKMLRNKQGLTQLEIANKMETSQQLVSFWENNKRTPTTKDIRKLAKVLNVSVEEILDCFN